MSVELTHSYQYINIEYNLYKVCSETNNIVNVEDNSPKYEDDSITKNTRCSYPLSFIPNSAVEGKYAGKGGHPDQIVFLACDAWGLLPPISKLEMQDALDFFLCGYTSKMAGTEMGINEPTPTFSACFGAAFLTLHPNLQCHLQLKV